MNSNQQLLKIAVDIFKQLGIFFKLFKRIIVGFVMAIKGVIGLFKKKQSTGE